MLMASRPLRVLAAALRLRQESRTRGRAPTTAAETGKTPETSGAAAVVGGDEEAYE
jgi:hypothetical protein